MLLFALVLAAAGALARLVAQRGNAGPTMSPDTSSAAQSWADLWNATVARKLKERAARVATKSEI